MVRTTLALTVIALFAGAQALAGTAALPSAADTTLIDNPEGAVSNGSGPHVRSGLNSQGWKMRAAIRFDVSGGVPAGATIDAVTLILHNSGPDVSPNNLPRTIDTHRLLTAWGEGGSATNGGQGVPAGPGDVTWLHTFYNPADPGSAPMWAAPGGDFAGGSSAAMMVGGPGYYSWSGSGLVEDVQRWLDSPEENHGWLLVGEEVQVTSAKKIDSRESEDAALRPLLLVEYTAGGPDDEDEDGDEDGESDDEGQDDDHESDDRPRTRARSGYVTEIGQP